MANVTVTDITVVSGSVEATVQVTAEGLGPESYTVNVNDAATGASEDFSGVVSPGGAEVHVLSFSPGPATSGLITAQTIEDTPRQDQVEWELYSPDDLAITNCSLSDTAISPGDSLFSDFEVTSDAGVDLQFDYAVMIGDEVVAQGEQTIFANGVSTYSASLNTGGLSVSNEPVTVEISNPSPP